MSHNLEKIGGCRKNWFCSTVIILSTFSEVLVLLRRFLKYPLYFVIVIFPISIIGCTGFLRFFDVHFYAKKRLIYPNKLSIPYIVTNA